MRQWMHRAGVGLTLAALVAAAGCGAVSDAAQTAPSPSPVATPSAPSVSAPAVLDAAIDALRGAGTGTFQALSSYNFTLGASTILGSSRDEGRYALDRDEFFIQQFAAFDGRKVVVEVVGAGKAMYSRFVWRDGPDPWTVYAAGYKGEKPTTSADFGTRSVPGALWMLTKTTARDAERKPTGVAVVRGTVPAGLALDAAGLRGVEGLEMLEDLEGTVPIEIVIGANGLPTNVALDFPNADWVPSDPLSAGQRRGLRGLTYRATFERAGAPVAIEVPTESARGGAPTKA